MGRSGNLIMTVPKREIFIVSVDRFPQRLKPVQNVRGFPRPGKRHSSTAVQGV
jgi:hypothetical protein